MHDKVLLIVFKIKLQLDFFSSKYVWAVKIKGCWFRFIHFIWVFKNIGNHCHVLYTKVISEIKKTAPLADVRLSKIGAVMKTGIYYYGGILLLINLCHSICSWQCHQELLWVACCCSGLPLVAEDIVIVLEKIKSATQIFIFYTYHGFAYCLVHSNESMYRYTPIEVSRKWQISCLDTNISYFKNIL